MSPMSLQLLQSPVVVFGPIFIVAILVILAIPSMMVPGAKADGVVKAIACYVLKTLGLVLLALSSVQLTYGLVVMQIPDFPSLAALIILFTVGLGIMVHESAILRRIDEASVMIPRLVFSYACEIIGAFICIFSTLSLAITYIVSEGSPEGIAGWEMSATLLLLGAIMTLGSSVHIGHRNKKAQKSLRAKKK